MRFMPTLDRAPATGEYVVLVDPGGGVEASFSREVAEVLRRALELFRPGLRFAGLVEGLGPDAVGACSHVVLPDVVRASVECVRRHRSDPRFLFFPVPLDFDATWFGLVRSLSDHLRMSDSLEVDEAELEGYLGRIGAVGRSDMPQWVHRSGLVGLGRRLRLAGLAKALLSRAAARGLSLPGRRSLGDRWADDHAFVRDRLHDEESREVLRRVVEGRAREIVATSLQSCFRVHQYLDTVRLGPGAVVLSGGVFRGEEIPGLLFLTSGRGRIHCFDPGGRADLAPHVRHWVDAFPEAVEFVESALGEETGTALFSRRSDGQYEGGRRYGASTLSFPSTTLDDFVRERALPSVDLLKLDIEGGEEAALRGATWTLSRHRPPLAISIYHRPTSYVEIPATLMRQCPDYDWLIRHYSFSGREVVLYGFPRERGMLEAALPA